MRKPKSKNRVGNHYLPTIKKRHEKIIIILSIGAMRF